jgi:hypothetical protein
MQIYQPSCELKAYNATRTIAYLQSVVGDLDVQHLCLSARRNRNHHAQVCQLLCPGVLVCLATIAKRCTHQQARISTTCMEETQVTHVNHVRAGVLSSSSSRILRSLSSSVSGKSAPFAVPSSIGVASASRPLPDCAALASGVNSLAVSNDPSSDNSRTPSSSTLAFFSGWGFDAAASSSYTQPRGTKCTTSTPRKPCVPSSSLTHAASLTCLPFPLLPFSPCRPYLWQQ